MARLKIDSILVALVALALFHILWVAPAEAAKFSKPVFVEEFGTVT